MTSGVVPTGGATPADLLAVERRRRADAVIASQGNLALTNTQWITGDASASQPIWGVPGLWSPLPRGESGLRVTASAAEGIVVDDVLIDGTVALVGMDTAGPSRIRFSDTATGTVIASDDGDYALRVWDADSPGIGDFGAIEAFPYDPRWVFEARFTPNVGEHAVSIAHINEHGKTREAGLPGQIHFTLDGSERSLVVFDDGASVLLVFADATTGHTSYSVGRFLRLVPSDTGAVMLDFNQAYLPPCAFSYHFTCPIPPAHNRLHVAIEAGERNVVNTHGDPLH